MIVLCKCVLYLRNVIIITLCFQISTSWASTAHLLLHNPDFEMDDMSPWIRTAITGIRPWSLGGADPQSGSWAVFAVYSCSIRQNFPSTKGYRIREFTFWAKRESAANVSLIIHYADGQHSGLLNLNSLINAGWTKVNILPFIGLHDDLTGIEIVKTNDDAVAWLDNFRAYAYSGPVISDLSLSFDSLEFEFRALEPGVEHLLQSKERLSDARWTQQISLMPTGRTTRIQHSLSKDSQSAFFRVIRP